MTRTTLQLGLSSKRYYRKNSIAEITINIVSTLNRLYDYYKITISSELRCRHSYDNFIIYVLQKVWFDKDETYTYITILNDSRFKI